MRLRCRPEKQRQSRMLCKRSSNLHTPEGNEQATEEHDATDLLDLVVITPTVNEKPDNAEDN